jgi:REP element-mobilizing transposase RayT
VDRPSGRTRPVFFPFGRSKDFLPQILSGPIPAVSFSMARVARKYLLTPGLGFHKIWRAHNREHLLREGSEKQAYIEAIARDYQDNCDSSALQLHAFCIMGNHVHEAGTLPGELHHLSNHMRRAHGCFGLKFNKRKGRLGKVACERPKTLAIQNDESAARCHFYIHANPVRAGIIKTPWAIQWRMFSTCRLYTHGERNRLNRFIQLPEWYLRLGPTPKARQAAYRRLLVEYLRKCGLVRDRSMTRGHFIGSNLWVEAKRSQLRALKARGYADSTAPP